MSTVPVPPLIPGSMNLQTLEVGTAKITSIVGDVMSTLNSWKGSVTAASTANVASLSGVGAALDGVTLAENDVVLLKDQTTGSENGFWLVTNNAWTRNENLIAGSNAAGIAVFVNEGSTNSDTIWVCTNDEAAAVVGTDALVFATITSVIGAAGSDTQVQFNNAGALGGAAGLTYNVGTNVVTTTGLTNLAGGAISAGTIQAATLTDGALTSTAGTITNGVAATFSGAVTAGSLTDGTATLSSGALSGATTGAFSGLVNTGGVTSTATIQGPTLSDGVASLNAGALSGVTDLTTTGNTILGNAVTDTLGFYGVGPIAQGAAVTPAGAAPGAYNQVQIQQIVDAVNNINLRLQAYGLLA
jgi:hypothetical protein